jgi:hypothetical protein
MKILLIFLILSNCVIIREPYKIQENKKKLNNYIQDVEYYPKIFRVYNVPSYNVYYK